MIVALSLVLLTLQGSPAETVVAAAADVAHCLQQGSVTAADKEDMHRGRMMVNHCCVSHFCHATQGYALLNEADGNFSLSPIIFIRLVPYNTAAVVSRPLTPPFHPPKA